MPTQSKTKTTRNGAGAKSTATAPHKPAARRTQARSVAESAVDVPVGVVLNASDRIAGLVEPFSDRTAADRQLKDYRTRVRKALKRSERRGATARRKATSRARKRTRQLADRVGQLPALR